MAVKKIKVKMLVNTAYQGPRKEGDVIEVPEDFAKRWVKNGIAGYVDAEEEVQEEEVVEEVEAETPEETKEAEETSSGYYAEMSAKELFDLCQEKGIDVEPKQKKAYYLEKLA